MHTYRDFRQLHVRIHDWYASYGRRDLPWRTTKDPYAIYISEIMLQQTQVKTVLERFYTPFLKAFPTLQALAGADQEAVLKQWEGLGYYSRARNLHRAAQEASPELPQTVEDLLALPGIGKNTAHALAAFAFKQPVPVMEANVARVLARFYALKFPPPAQLWEKAGELLDKENPFDYNQAMMDIGALICTPARPECSACPLSAKCQGQSDPLTYPGKKVKKPTPIRQRNIVLYMNHEGQAWVAPRQTRFLGGLFGFPELDSNAPLPSHAVLLGPVRQVYSHFRLEAQVWQLSVERYKPNTLNQEEGRWVTRQEALTLPMSRADHKVLVLWENQKEPSPPLFDHL